MLEVSLLGNASISSFYMAICSCNLSSSVFFCSSSPSLPASGPGACVRESSLMEHGLLLSRYFSGRRGLLTRLQDAVGCSCRPLQHQVRPARAYAPGRKPCATVPAAVSAGTFVERASGVARPAAELPMDTPILCASSPASNRSRFAVLKLQDSRAAFGLCSLFSCFRSVLPLRPLLTRALGTLTHRRAI